MLNPSFGTNVPSRMPPAATCHIAANHPQTVADHFALFLATFAVQPYLLFYITKEQLAADGARIGFVRDPVSGHMLSAARGSIDMTRPGSVLISAAVTTPSARGQGHIGAAITALRQSFQSDDPQTPLSAHLYVRVLAGDPSNAMKAYQRIGFMPVAVESCAILGTEADLHLTETADRDGKYQRLLMEAPPLFSDATAQG